MAKYSKLELDAAHKKDILERMLSECTCDESREFPLDPSYHIGSLGERFLAARMEKHEKLRD